MRTPTLFSLLRPTALLIAGILALPAAVELAGISVGTHISGPKVDANDLSGKVVIFEYWGINCGPCLANIPHVSELAALSSPDALVVIANQCQGTGSTAQKWAQYKGTDKVTVVDNGDLKGANVSGIPRVFAFDHTGKMVFDGHPAQLTATMVSGWLSAAPGPLVAAGNFPACVQEVAALRQKGTSIASPVASLRRKAAGTVVDAAAQAKTLLDGIDAYFAKKTTAVTTARSADPLTAQNIVEACIALTRGDAVLAKPWTDLAAELKADKAFQKELAAARELEPIKAGIAKISAQAPVNQPPLKAQATDLLTALAKRHAGTKAASEATALTATLK